MSSSKKYLSRRRPYRPKRKLFVISSEGKVTEPRYFKELNTEVNNFRIHIVIDRFGTDPNSVVEAAINFKSNNDLNKNDEIWVVVDTDFSRTTRQTKERQLTDAGIKCEELGFGYAVSNPCFEFWLLLHFDDRPSIRSTERVQDKCISRLKVHYPNYEKSSYDPGKFVDKVEKAIRNAKQLDRSRDGLWPQNHGSTVYLLMEKIIENSQSAI